MRKETVLKRFNNKVIPITSHIIPEESKKLTKDKAYILGVLCGDGYLWSKSKESYQIGLDVTDEDFADEFKKCLFNVYNISPSKKLRKARNKNWRDEIVIKLCAKAVFEDLLKYDSLGFKTKTWSIPEQIKNSNLDMQGNFLKGFYDSEGSVSKNDRRVALTSSNLKALKNIKILLYNRFKIRSEINKGTRAFDLRIQDRRSVEKFAECIGFSIKRKDIKLKSLIKNYKLYITPHKEAKKLDKEIIKLRNKGLSYAKISKKAGLSAGTVWGHLNIKS